VNITGGNKMMAFAAYEIFTEIGQKVIIGYVPLGRNQFVPDTPPSHPAREFFPQRRYLSPDRIAVPDQKLKLMSHQNLQLPNLIAWPPPKPTPAQSLLAEPKSLAVIDEDLDRRTSFVTKYKQQSRERVCLQHFPAYPGQAINAPAKVHRLHRHPDLHLRSDLDHHPCLQKARLSSTGSTSLRTPLKDILIFAPFAASIST